MIIKSKKHKQPVVGLMAKEYVQKVVNELKIAIADSKDDPKRQVKAVVKVMDGWANMLTGLGVAGADKRNAGIALYNGALQEWDAEQLYASDPLARRMCDLLPDEGTRKWIEEADIEKEITDDCLRLNVREKFNEAWKASRQYGGAGIYVNTGDSIEELGKPLDENNIKKIKALTVFNRWELWVNSTDVERDLNHPNFGMPVRYYLQPRGSMGQKMVPIHNSRIIRFDGLKLPRLLFIQNNFWSDSMFTAIYELLRDFNVAVAGVANVVQDLRVFWYQIKGLADAIANGQEALVQKRIQMANLARSVIGAHILDAEEKMGSEQQTYRGIEELVEVIKSRLQYASSIPHTILFNESPAGGLNGAGGHELTTWYDHVHSIQEVFIRPKLDRFFKLLFLSKKGPTNGVIPEDWVYEFEHLLEADESEEAKNYYQMAQGDQIYADLGMDAGVLLKKRFPDDITDEDLAFEQTSQIQEDQDNADELAEQQKLEQQRAAAQSAQPLPNGQAQGNGQAGGKKAVKTPKPKTPKA